MTKTYYFKLLDDNSYIVAISKVTSSRAQVSTPSRVILSKSEYDYLVTVNANKPQPSDDMHEVRILDNHDGTYTYIEITETEYEELYQYIQENAEHIVSEEDVIENE